MQAICNGKGGMPAVWSDGSGLAACGSSENHRLHAFERPLVARQSTDALAGEFLQATIGTVYRVHPNCGSAEQHIGTMDYDYPDPIRVRFAVCRTCRQAEQVTA